MARNDCPSPQGLTGWTSGGSAGNTVTQGVPVTGMQRPTAAVARQGTATSNLRLSAPHRQYPEDIGGRVVTITMEGRPNVAANCSLELVFRNASGGQTGVVFTAGVALAAGQTHTAVMVGVAPAGTFRVQPTWLARGVPTGTEVAGTAARIDLVDEPAMPFRDGDSPGWGWEGARGTSMSAELPPAPAPDVRGARSFTNPGRVGGSAGPPGPTTLTAGPPSTTLVGDLLVAVGVIDNDGQQAALQAPAGWAPLDPPSGPGGLGGYVKLWARRATSADRAAAVAGSRPWTFGQHPDASGVVTVLALMRAEADPDGSGFPVWAGAARTSPSATHTAPSITVADVPALVLLLFTGNGNGTHTPPAGWTELVDVTSGWQHLAVAGGIVRSATSTGPQTATATSSTAWTAGALAFTVPAPVVAAEWAEGLATAAGAAGARGVHQVRARGTATAGSSAGSSRTSAQAARGAAASSSSAQVTAALEIRARGSAGSRSHATDDPVALLAARASGRASSSADLRPSGVASAHGTAASAGRALAGRVVQVAARALASGAGSSTAGRVVPASGSSTASTAGTGHARLVGRTPAAGTGRALGDAALAAAARVGARAGNAARSLAGTVKTRAARAAERAHTRALAHPGPITPGRAHEDATAATSARATPVARDLTGWTASSTGGATAGRVVPLSARGLARAGSATHPSAAGTGTAHGHAGARSGASPDPVALDVAAAGTATSLGRAGTGRVVQLRAAAACGASSTGRPRGVAAGTATAAGRGSTTSTPAGVAPSGSTSTGRAVARVHAQRLRPAGAHALVGSEGIAGPRRARRGSALAGAQTDGHGLARLVGAPPAEGVVLAVGAGSAARVSAARAAAGATTTGATLAARYTAAGRAVGTASTNGVVQDAVDIPGVLDPSARPAGLTATAYPADLEVTVS